MNYEAILFDMDGVIVDTHQSVTAFWERWAAKHGVHISAADFVQQVYGRPGTHTLDALFPMLNEDDRQAIFDDMAAYEVRLIYTAVNGAVDCLRALRRHGVPTALVTSGARWKVQAVAGQLGLDGLFTTQVTVEDIHQGKPHPEGYLLAAHRLGKAPERCIVFEDAISGVEAAVAAGALCIGVQAAGDPSSLLTAGAQTVIPDFSAVRLQTSADALTLHLGPSYRLSLIGRTPPNLGPTFP